MPNTGGSNGTVSAVTSSASGSTVTVHYPDAPDPPGRDETYDPAPDWFVRRCDAAVPPRDKMDVVCDGLGNPTSATNHK